MNSKISIIIPTLNEEKIIEKTLKSLREYHGDCEIIVSDGKSTDRTIEIAKKYADKVIVYDGVARQTIGMGRNLGAASASGDFLLFLDADVSIPNPDRFFSITLNRFDKNSKLVALIPFIRVFPEMATLMDKIVFSIVNFNFYLMNNVFHKGAAGGEFQMVRADVFKKLGGYDETLSVSEDQEFFWRLCKVGRTHIEPSLVIYHTSRRAHKIGWPKLLWSWFINLLSVMFRKKAHSEVWEEIR